MDKNSYGSKLAGNARRSAAAPGSGKKHGAKGGKKQPIKVVYISNPMRVTTSAAGFRALVQELTGRHADPSKYDGGAAADVEVDESATGAEPLLQAGALPSPASTVESPDTAGSDDVVPAAAAYGGDDDFDYFPPQLIDNRYCVFSPPTFLYSSHVDEL